MKKHLLPFLILVISVSLSGCNLPSPTTCTTGELVAPAQTSPAMWAVVGSLSPTLSWESTDSSVPYPYDSCFPSGYNVSLRLATSSFDIGGDNYGGYNRDWTPASPLAPGSEYHWGVNAFSPTGDGPYAGDRVFFTGPMCATGALLAPLLNNPGNGTIVNTVQPLLTWDYPNPCLPQGYRIDLSTDSSFADTSLSGGTGNPSTSWFPGSDLTNCTWYYWRVAPINGTTLGPFSITRNFMVNTGSCLYPLPDVFIPIEPLITIPPFLPEFIFDLNGNCRIGDSQLYPVRTSFLAGQAIPIIGRNEHGSWLYTGKDECFVSIAIGKFNGDPNLLPLIDSPPLPEPPPEATKKPTRVPPSYNSCSDYSTQDLCKQDPEGFGCYWGQNNVCVPLQ